MKSGDDDSRPLLSPGYRRLAVFVGASILLHFLAVVLFGRFLPSLPTLQMRHPQLMEVTLIHIAKKPAPKAVPAPRRTMEARATPDAPSSHRSAIHHAAVRPSEGRRRIALHIALRPLPKTAPVIAKTVSPAPAPAASRRILTASSKIDTDVNVPQTVPVQPELTAPQNPFPVAAPPTPVPAQPAAPLPANPTPAPPGPAAPPSGQGTAGSGSGDTGAQNGDSGGAGNGNGPFGLGIGNGQGLRHIVYVVDVSFSMASRLETVKAEMGKSLNGMEPGESFTIIAFGGNVTWYDEQLEPATPANVDQATDYLNTLMLRQGTDLQSAIYKALDVQGVNVVVVMTDGVPTWGETDFNAIAKNVRKKNGNVHARIFAVGLIGRNPDGTDDSFDARQLLQRLCADSGGSYTEATVGIATPD